MAIPVFETLNTIQFTFVSSVAPDAAPLFSVEDKDGTVVASFTAVTSDSTHYYAMYTLPSNLTHQVALWTAVKTVSGSAYNFTRRQVFKVKETQVP